MLMNLNLVVPAAAAIMVIIAAIVVICVIKGRNNGHKGLLWLSCYSVHLLFHFHFVWPDDVIYNQASASNATMKRNGGDMRDELGYIPPPNRKLPPVPGTQYNTCDRIKRGNYSIQSIFFISSFLFFFLLSIQWYAMSVCNARLFFKFSFTIKKRKKKEHLVVDDSLNFFLFIYPDGSAFVTILSLISVSVRYICIAFFHSRILFFSGYTHSIHTSTKNTWQNTHNTHKTYIYAYEKQKKGHADCHAYRTLDPRRPVYDELSIHPPPRRNIAVPGEEVNQSGASLYAGKWKPLPYHSSLTLLCLIFCLDLHNLNTFSYTLGWRHTLTKQKESRWQSVWYSFLVLTVFFH